MLKVLYITTEGNVTLPPQKRQLLKLVRKSWLEHQAICLAITFDILGLFYPSKSQRIKRAIIHLSRKHRDQGKLNHAIQHAILNVHTQKKSTSKNTKVTSNNSSIDLGRVVSFGHAGGCLKY